MKKLFLPLFILTTTIIVSSELEETDRKRIINDDGTQELLHTYHPHAKGWFKRRYTPQALLACVQQHPELRANRISASSTVIELAFYVSENEAREKIIKDLINAQVPIDQENFNGTTFLQKIASEESFGEDRNIVKTLLKYKASVEKRNSRGSHALALALACENGYHACILSGHTSVKKFVNNFIPQPVELRTVTNLIQGIVTGSGQTTCLNLALDQDYSELHCKENIITNLIAAGALVRSEDILTLLRSDDPCNIKYLLPQCSLEVLLQARQEARSCATERCTLDYMNREINDAISEWRKTVNGYFTMYFPVLLPSDPQEDCINNPRTLIKEYLGISEIR